ncbi:RDD family protein [Chitinimonas sp.]|uniref:RDD family protein n=1 Tax=Chitinimonas sp. TaxID=1934313 RepID=UPI002F94EF28
MQQNNPNPYAVSEGIALDVSDQAGEPAGRWHRLGASLIDSLILSIVIWPVILFVFQIPFASVATLGLGAKLLLGTGSFLTYVLINGYLLYQGGQTVGKKLLGIRVVKLDGSKATLLTLTVVRHLPLNLVGLIPVVGSIIQLADALFIFRENRRCLHDLIAGTKVVVA